MMLVIPSLSELLISTHEQVLAALDVHTSKWIVDKCFAGDLVKDRTVILVVRACRLNVTTPFLRQYRHITLLWRVL